MTETPGDLNDCDCGLQGASHVASSSKSPGPPSPPVLDLRHRGLALSQGPWHLGSAH